MDVYPFEDLKWVIDRAMERGSHLLTDVERRFVEVVRGLSEAEGILFARLLIKAVVEIKSLFSNSK